MFVRFSHAAGFRQFECECEMCFAEIRLRPYRFREMPCCFTGRSAQQRVPEIVMRERILWVDAQRGFVVRNCAGFVAALIEQLAEIHVRCDAVRIDKERRLIFFDGSIELSLLREKLSEVHTGFGKFRFEAQGCSEFTLRFCCCSEGAQRERQTIARLDREWIASERRAEMDQCFFASAQ